MKFEDFPYERPDVETFKNNFNKALKAFTHAESAQTQEKAMDDINQLWFDYETMATLANIRHTIDTTDAFYEQEKVFFNQNSPVFNQMRNQFYEALLKASFKDHLIEKKGDLLFRKAKQSLATFDDSIMEELKEENRLANEHQKLLASAQIEFDGETYNLSQMTPFMQHTDRSVRKRASQAIMAFFETHEETIDDIYDQLITIRTRMAEKLGYASFTDLAYNRLGRLDYGPEEVARWREEVKRLIVPINQELAERKRKRLDLDTLYHYDGLDFKTGNPTPKGDTQELVERALEMYKAMSPQTDEFFTHMVENNLMDLESKKGKAGGGYCTFIPNHDSPFIFANFNGTKGDVDVLTHEAGHAFQMYMSRGKDVPEYHMATMEASEIHSMSMEFFAWPWAAQFFGDDADKYKFSHLSQALMLVAYGASIDEFQHEIYKHPSMSKQERKTLWRDIEKTYFPHREYDDAPYYERGGSWQRIMHIFAVPFYMIDYTLAQACAFQFFTRTATDEKAAWDDYLTLCKTGGEKTFTDLVDLANLKNPFEVGALENIIPNIKQFLDNIDDTSL